MKKGKRILALIGAVILAGLYVATLICALIGSSDTMNLLMSAIYASVVFPVLIWIYQFVYKLIKKDHSIESDTQKKH